MTDPVVVGIESGNKWVKEANVIPKTLWTKNTPAYYSSEDSAGKYQVPADKKFIILQLRTMRQQTHLDTPLLFETTVPNNSSGTIILNGPCINDTMMIYNTYIEVGAGKYFGNWAITNIASIIYGVECDA
jgi:hypothetical protein